MPYSVMIWATTDELRRHRLRKFGCPTETAASDTPDATRGSASRYSR